MKVLTNLLLFSALVVLVFAQNYNRDGHRHGSQYKNHGHRYGYRRGGNRYGGNRYGSRYGSHRGGYRPGSGYGGYNHGSGYGYKRIICPKLTDPTNGNVQVSGLRPGSKAVYKCNVGHVLVGVDTRTCQNNGKWSAQAPICKRINCGPLPDIANGKVVIAPDTRLGSTATYSCNTGFNLVGAATRQCQASGQWSGQEPSCEPVDCGTLPDPQNGWAHISPNTLLGAVVIYRCKLGFQLSDQERRYCEANGQWSGVAPTCNPISCGNPPTPDPNGNVVSTGTSLGDTATYYCNDGFVLEGTKTIYCQNNGKWSDDAPKCNPIDCGAPDPADPNGDLNVDRTTLGGTASYSCNAGFVLVGQSTATCQSNGEWSSDAPVCEPVDCGSLPAPENGDVSFYPGTTFLSTASFVCDRGFRLVGDRSRTCQANGQWSGQQPTCQKIKCPKLRPPQYGKIYTSGYYPGDYAAYDCNYGYKLIGKHRRHCLHSGRWSGSDYDCIKEQGYGYDYGHSSY